MAKRILAGAIIVFRVHERTAAERKRQAGKESRMTTRAKTYCCFRFRESVKVDKTIMKATGYDETEWYIPQGSHIYFCPFCGRKIKGRGFGTYAQAALTVEQMKKLKRDKASSAPKASTVVRAKRIPQKPIW
jgi:hypothetical protein